MGEEEAQAAEAAYAALVGRDWPRLRLLLHPYLHWTGEDGLTVRGRVKVLALFAERAAPAQPPVALDLRDGQIYRWHSA